MVDFIELHWFEMLFAGICTYMIYHVVKNGGFKNALFGAKQKSEVGKVLGRKRFGIVSSIVVHKMNDTDTGKEIVGLELVQKALLSYSMQPLSLEKSEALKLAELLQKAADEKGRI